MDQRTAVCERVLFFETICSAASHSRSPYASMLAQERTYTHIPTLGTPCFSARNGGSSFHQLWQALVRLGHFCCSTKVNINRTFFPHWMQPSRNTPRTKVSQCLAGLLRTTRTCESPCTSVPSCLAMLCKSASAFVDATAALCVETNGGILVFARRYVPGYFDHAVLNLQDSLGAAVQVGSAVGLGHHVDDFINRHMHHDSSR